MPTDRTAHVINASPAIKLVAVLAVAIVLQSAWGLPVACGLSLWALFKHRTRFFTMLRRIRWLIVVLFLVTLLMTPGTALFPAWGLYPTAEGVALGVTQLLRLIGMLAAVSLLLDTTDDRSLAAGCLSLLQPLAGQRQWPTRAVARLLLVFHYLETAPQPRSLQDVLTFTGADLNGVPESSGPEVLVLDVVPLSAREQVFALLILLTAVFSLAWGAG